MTGDRSLREYDLESGDEAVVDDPLVFLAQPDSIIITSEFADAERAAGRRAFHSVDDGGRQSVHRARRDALGRPDERVWRQSRGHGHLRRAAGVRPRPAVRSHRLEAPGGHPGGQRARCRSSGAWCRIRGQPPSSRGQQLESTLAVYAISMNISSVFALFIGMFIIYNSFSIAVTQRRSEIGVSARARCPSPADSESVSHRKRRKRPGGLGGRHRSWHRDGARHGGIDLQHARRHLRSGRTRRGGVGRSAAARSGDGDWRRHQHAGRVAARPQCVSSRSGSGASEGQVSGPDGRRKPHAPAPRGGVDGGRRRLPLDRQVGLVLRRLYLDRRSPRCCSFRPLPCGYRGRCGRC